MRIVNAKVMRAVQEQPNSDGTLRSGFDEDARPEDLVERAIRTVVGETRCRVFNLSIGSPAHVLDGQAQLPWACVLDELARELDIVLVVSAGNKKDPDLPSVHTAEDLHSAVLEQLLTPAHCLIDPAPAVNTRTVGALSRSGCPYHENGGRRALLAGSPAGAPAPFTRAGIVEGNGSGVRRTIKPELVAYGGNYSVGPSGRWEIHPGLCEPVLSHTFNEAPLVFTSGTSVAAPFVTHVCALVESRLKELLNGSPSANLIRALTAHSARPPANTEAWLSGRGSAEDERRRLRLIGYGLPDPELAMYSANNRVTLVAEDEIDDDGLHIYEVQIPKEFIEREGKRTIRMTLAYDPPVRGSRREYVARTMRFDLFRGHTANELFEALSASDGDLAAPAALDVAEMRPPFSRLQWSTVQSAAFTAQRDQKVQHGLQPDGAALWHVAVRSTARFSVAAGPQKYAFVLSLEHSDAEIELHRPVTAKATKPRRRQRARAVVA